MPRFTLRMNAEYTTTVEADTEEAAIETGQAIEAEDWDSMCWSEVEAEQEYESEPGSVDEGDIPF